MSFTLHIFSERVLEISKDSQMLNLLVAVLVEVVGVLAIAEQEMVQNQLPGEDFSTSVSGVSKHRKSRI